jgi:hypothetical protein
MQDHEVRVGSHTVMIELGIQGGTYQKSHGMVMHENSTDLEVLEHAESYFFSLTDCILNLDGLLV